MRRLIAGVAAVLFAAAGALALEEKLPEVSGEKFVEEGKIIRITYDLNADGPRTIDVMASVDGGKTWNPATGELSGDIGPRVWPGKKKEILWTHDVSLPGGFNNKLFQAEVAFGPAEPLPPPPPGVVKYALIPIRGEFGLEVMAADVEGALASAATAGVDAVVFDVDSPGGSGSELKAIAEAVIKWKESHKQIKTVSFASGNAFSAAALFSFACDEIWLHPRSAIGAAMGINVSGRSVTAVEEKFSSAHRGEFRGYAEFAGHDPMLLEAMMDANFVISCGTKEGKQVAARGTPAELEKYGFEKPPRLILDKGRLLTFTAKEAVECGLAAGMAESVEELGTKRGAPGWALADEAGKELAVKRGSKNAESFEKIKFLVYTINEERKDLRKIEVKSRDALLSVERNLLQIDDAFGEIASLIEQNPSAYRYFTRLMSNDDYERLNSWVKEALLKIREFKSRR